MPVETESDIQKAFKKLGDSIRIKTRTLGYDGKGQLALNASDDLSQIDLSLLSHPCIGEGHVDFEGEVSILAVRDQNGEVVFYPPIENQHENGILRHSAVPNMLSIQNLDETHLSIQSMLEQLEYVGLLAVEFFVVNGKLVVNEMAPRVHNSGHLTTEAFDCSQFENHLRAICGFKIIAPNLKTPSSMLNVIGAWPELTAYHQAGTHIYDYGKAPRANRKLGHITLKGRHMSNPSTPYCITVILEAKPDQIEVLKSELEKVAPKVRAEDTCLSFKLHQGIDNPAEFVLHETWVSKEKHQEQFEKEHIIQLAKKLPDLLLQHKAVYATELMPVA